MRGERRAVEASRVRPEPFWKRFHKAANRKLLGEIGLVSIGSSLQARVIKDALVCRRGRPESPGLSGKLLRSSADSLSA